MPRALASFCLLAAACCLLAPTVQAQRPEVGAAPAAAPLRFERILWLHDQAAAKAAANAGFTAVQLPRGGDPAPLRALGLGYYLDQPIGKGLLELRDEDWRPVAVAYERTRDPAVLVRPGCWQAPGRLAAAAQAVAAEVARVAGPGLCFVALADEASATRHDAPLDTCRCAECLAAFRAFALARHGGVAALDAALGTAFEEPAAVVPLTTDQVRRRELGDVSLPQNLAPFALHREFVATQFAAAVGELCAAAQRAAGSAPVGLTGMPAPAAFGGNDYAALAPFLGVVEAYRGGGAPELAASLLAPNTQRYATLFPAADAVGGLPLADRMRAEVAALAAHGYAGAVVWSDREVLGVGGEPTEYGAAVQKAFAAFGPALDACAGATIEPSSCWLVESPASVQAWWMLDSARDGMTWVRRLASYEAEHSTSQAARLGWSRLLQDLGLQPQFVAAEGLPERLLRERPRCLVLPALLALDDRTVQAITGYVQAGGTLLADHSTALYDGDLRLRASGGLDSVFGIRERSLRWADLRVREGTSGAAQAGELPLAELGLRGAVADHRQKGDLSIEQRSGRGRAHYLNAPVVDYARLRLDPAQAEKARELRRRVRAVLQLAGVESPCDVRGQGLPTCIERVPLRLRDGRSVLAIRLHALEAPNLLRTLSAAGLRTITVEFSAPRALRRLGGDPLPVQAKFELPLDPCGAVFLEGVGR
jgi:hypothetical protein